jgi:hypothetical protein
MCDELTRSGNLFVLISTDSSGMSYVRCVPALDIERIEARSNDVEQALWFYPKGTMDDPAPMPWPAYDKSTDAPGKGREFEEVMLHYAINQTGGRAVG